MTSTVKYHLAPQNPQSSASSHTVTVNFSPSTSNRSYSILKGVGGGVLALAGITGLTAIFYFSFFNKASKESASSTNTTETSTGLNGFADPTEPLMSESMQSLHNIVRLVTTDSNGYYNCAFCFSSSLGAF